MQDVADQEIRDSYRSVSFNNSSEGSGGRGGVNSNGFVVQGGPWEQRAPNMASVTEFPTVGGRATVEEPRAAPAAGVWGSRR